MAYKARSNPVVRVLRGRTSPKGTVTDRETGRGEQGKAGVWPQFQAVSTLQICSNPLADLHGKTPVGNPAYQDAPLPLQGSLSPTW